MVFGKEIQLADPQPPLANQFVQSETEGCSASEDGPQPQSNLAAFLGQAIALARLQESLPRLGFLEVREVGDGLQPAVAFVGARDGTLFSTKPSLQSVFSRRTYQNVVSVRGVSRLSADFSSELWTPWHVTQELVSAKWLNRCLSGLKG